MEYISRKMPFLWESSESSNLSSSDPKNYPSEILQNCLYLGDAHHSRDKEVIKTLGITHILNVTEEITNSFENSGELGISYKKIDLEDVACEPIHLAFKQAFEFIDSVVSGSKYASVDSWDDFGEFEEEKTAEEVKFQGVEMDSRTLKLDLKSETLTDWMKDDIKNTTFSIDNEVDTLHKQNSGTRILVHCAMGRSRSASIVMMYIMKKFQTSFKTAKQIVSHRREVIDPNKGFIQALKDFEEDKFKFCDEDADNLSESTEGEENLPLDFY